MTLEFIDLFNKQSRFTKIRTRKHYFNFGQFSLIIHNLDKSSMTLYLIRTPIGRKESKEFSRVKDKMILNLFEKYMKVSFF